MLPESSSTNSRFGLTDTVEEVARGEVANATEAACAGVGMTRAELNRATNKRHAAGLFSRRSLMGGNLS